MSEKEKFVTHAVFKWEDIRKYLSEEQQEQLRQIKATIGDGRVQDGKKRKNLYYVCNLDEPYANEVLEVILNGEEKNNVRKLCEFTFQELDD